MHARTLAALAVLTLGTALAAEPPPPGGVPDIVGARTLGLSAAIGTATGNDGLYLNPGAIAARKRYSVEAELLLDRRGAETVDRFLGGSVVDSQSSPVTAGVSYLRAQEGVSTGNIVHLALAGPVAERLFLGLGGKYYSLRGDAGRAAELGVTAPQNTSAATVDVGVLWQVADLVSLGIAGYNLVPIANDAVAPMGAGAGVALGNDRTIQVTGDWRADFDRRGKTTNRYAAGAEVLLGRLVPVRAGWMKDETLDTSWWSIGAGLVAQNGVALDIGYRQSLDDPSARTIAANLKLFLMQ